MSDFILSPAARQDLFDIWEFIARDDFDTADRVRDELFAAMSAVSDMPEKGHFRTDLVDEPLRFWRVYTYLIIYRPASNPLEIVRVLSAYRNVKQILKNPTESD